MKTAGIFTAELDENDQPTWQLPSGRHVTAEQVELTLH
jgi:hypothetical protein